MGFLLFIILILFLILGWPLLRGWLYMRSLRQRVNETFGQGRRQQQQQQYDDYGSSQQRGYSDDDEQQDNYGQGDRKIFDSSDGEYVEFEEIKGERIETQTVADDGSTSWRTVEQEEQIIDVEFEEIR